MPVEETGPVDNALRWRAFFFGPPTCSGHSPLSQADHMANRFDDNHDRKEAYMWILRILVICLLLLSAANPAIAKKDKPFVTVMTHDSFAVSQTLLDSFKQQTGVEIRILKSGDAGAALNQAILSRKNPLADVFFGVDNTFMSRALVSGIFEPYASPLLKNVPDSLKLDASNRLLPIDYGDVCLNYDIAWFKKKGLAPPGGLADLTAPAYRGLTVVQNPATSSPGLAFLLTTIGTYGEDGYLNFWEKLRENDVYISNGWSDAYYGKFTRAKGGTRPIVVSYASSPAAEVYYSDKKLQSAPTAAVLSAGSAYRQIEFAGILKGTRKPDRARKLVDFMLSPAFQKEIPLHMWVFPANPKTPLPGLFLQYAQQSQAPVMLAPKTIEAGRESWIEAWTDKVLR
jgi:thiamine transport system substrate-binding protein